ncbi:uncharacterized protein LOC101746156 [Bombyx mori]|uniref:uncharacterized protein LOC101746156 n=1 Tax=Bombyx mori TaxID=7091 RepID=UPI002ED23E1A
MANNYGLSDAELNLIKTQASRRAEMRREFLKQRTNPWKNASEAGYVFDTALQRFLSMKVTQFEYFTVNKRTSLFGFFVIVVPMFTFGTLIWNERTQREQKIRSGELRYKDRLFKLVFTKMSGYGFSETDCKIILKQIERRAKFRQEFLKLKSDPCKHSQEAGYVFDPAIQRFLSMKSCQVEYFKPCFRTARFAILTIIVPMCTLGVLIWNDRTEREQKIRRGELRYKDRLFKLA